MVVVVVEGQKMGKMKILYRPKHMAVIESGFEDDTLAYKVSLSRSCPLTLSLRRLFSFLDIFSHTTK